MGCAFLMVVAWQSPWRYYKQTRGLTQFGLLLHVDVNQFKETRGIKNIIIGLSGQLESYTSFLVGQTK